MTREQADGDLISKNKLILYLNDWRFGVAPDETTPIKDQDKRLVMASTIYDCMLTVENFPTVAIPQEPKTGHWIRQNNTKEPLYGWYFCSECNSVIGDKTKFCSNCGAKMVEPQERSEE